MTDDLNRPDEDELPDDVPEEEPDPAKTDVPGQNEPEDEE